MAKYVYACAKFTRLKKRLPQIYCWKERLGRPAAFGVWDYQNGRQNGNPALFRAMEINCRNTILSSACKLNLTGMCFIQVYLVVK